MILTSKITSSPLTQPYLIVLSNLLKHIAQIYIVHVFAFIGGSEKFQDKQEFFFSELIKHHKRQSRSEIKLTINRFDLLESVSAYCGSRHDLHTHLTNFCCLSIFMIISYAQARAATKRFSSSDWCKKFVVEFSGEEGTEYQVPLIV